MSNLTSQPSILTQALNLNNCDRQPIHNLGLIQPHGVLLSLQTPQLKILQVSANSEQFLGLKPDDLLNQNLDDLIDDIQLKQLKQKIAINDFDIINPLSLTINQQQFDVIIHRNVHGLLIIEFEPKLAQESLDFADFYRLIRIAVSKMHKADNLQDTCQILVTQLRQLLGFERILVYKYDADWHGFVIAEDKEPELESYLDLHYPESDVPKQARQLYVDNWIRSIVDSHAQSVPIIPSKDPLINIELDLSFSVLRSVFPCHLEYLQNWGVRGSMSISIIQDQKLWGLIACLDSKPKFIPYEVRKACEFLGQVMSLELLAKENNLLYQQKLHVKDSINKLIESMSKSATIDAGLTQQSSDLLEFVNAQGAAVYFQDQYHLYGITPSIEQINNLIDWLEANHTYNLFHTDSLIKFAYPHAEEISQVASGILSVNISRSLKRYIIWFRPEEIATVNWAGDPYNSYTEIESENGIRLCPRTSFGLWKEVVRNKSYPWQLWEIEAASELRSAIINIVLRKSDEMAKLAQELKRSNAELEKFAYVASHDLQEPLNQVVSYVQLLEMRYQQQLDDNAKEFINFAVEGVSQMQRLIDDLLAYSRVGTRAKEFVAIDLEKVLARVITNLQVKITETNAVITSDSLPTVIADEVQLVQLFQNLIANAIKFHSQQPPRIHIGVIEQNHKWLFSIQDNGIGLEEQFFERIFVIFQRLHTKDEYPGTGIGLTICKKIVEHHGGRIWVESKPGLGSTFYFTIGKGTGK